MKKQVEVQNKFFILKFAKKLKRELRVNNAMSCYYSQSSCYMAVFLNTWFAIPNDNNCEITIITV